MLRLARSFLPLALWPALASGNESYDYFETECLEDATGANYAGLVSKTKSGLTCQKWNANAPHDLTADRAKVLEHYGIDLNTWDHNYCRNPGGQIERPLCFTTSPTERWEYCDIPVCNTDMLPISEPATPEPPQTQVLTPKQVVAEVKKPEAKPISTQEITYNRNNRVRQQPSVIIADEELDLFESVAAEDDLFSEVDSEFSVEPIDCYQTSDKGASYQGKISKSASGATCQYWSSNDPVNLNSFTRYFKNNKKVDIREFPENKCRNPGGHFKRPICITGSSKKKYEFCDIPECDEASESNQVDAALGRILVNPEEEDCGVIDPRTDCYDNDAENTCFKPSKFRDRFLMCQAGQSFAKPCPENLEWNHAKLACDWPIMG